MIGASESVSTWWEDLALTWAGGLESVNEKLSFWLSCRESWDTLNSCLGCQLLACGLQDHTCGPLAGTQAFLP